MSTPEIKINDCSLHIATINGSGSQTSNAILIRSLFRMGLPVGGKNLFPSNIAGLPTWFNIRIHPQGWTSRKNIHDLVVAMNPASFHEDLKSLAPQGIFIFNQDIKLASLNLRGDVINIPIPFRQLVDTVTDSPKLKKFLTNMIYVGVVGEILGIPEDILITMTKVQFGAKAKVIESNLKALQVGIDYVRQNFRDKISCPFVLQAIEGGNKDKVLIDGNTAAALGALYGGCSFVAWYPITPSSSLVESFIKYAEKYRLDDQGNQGFAVLQAEDELASISMVLGAGWAGARAMTATSGPGLSLMAEAAGLSYYAEIPAVIWNVQRVGPSTGLPTRTMQGDLTAAAHLSHGDTEHIVLLPATPEECFEFGQLSFDLAERLQTLVIALSDLDLGMNSHISAKFQALQTPFDRGKVLTAQDLDKLDKFGRYLDVDGDGIAYRTLPGTEHPKAAYFTRGTGHDEYTAYSENNEIYKRNMDRLKKKFKTAQGLIPKPIVDIQPQASIGLIAYGSTDHCLNEVRFNLSSQGLKNSYMRIRALPFTEALEDFIKSHERVYVVEQNRDGQMKGLLQNRFPEVATKLHSVLHYDGLPIGADEVTPQILQQEGRL